jgi:hypothetical protein
MMYILIAVVLLVLFVGAAEQGGDMNDDVMP